MFFEFTRRYSPLRGLLLAPAEGCGLRPRFFLPFGQKSEKHQKKSQKIKSLKKTKESKKSQNISKKKKISKDPYGLPNELFLFSNAGNYLVIAITKLMNHMKTK